ncbi:DUF3304 domain-containing protein [Pseudoduganella sp. HUAS MS19]
MRIIYMHRWKVLALLLLVGVAIYFGTRDEEQIWVSVASVHYYPPNHRVEEVQIDTHDYGNSGFDGDAGMGMCCIWIPKLWRPGIVVDVRWVVSDWTETPIDDKEHFDHKKIKLVGMYRAKVHVERYTEADDVFVHFFNGGKVRVVPGLRDFRDKKNLDESIKKAEEGAVVGQKVSELYTASEEAEILEARERERERRRSWWR